MVYCLFIYFVSTISYTVCFIIAIFSFLLHAQSSERPSHCSEMHQAEVVDIKVNA